MDNQLKIIQLENKKYFLVDTIKNLEEEYYYFLNLQDHTDILILENEKEFLKQVSDSEKFTNILALFYDKYQAVNT